MASICFIATSPRTHSSVREKRTGPLRRASRAQVGSRFRGKNRCDGLSGRHCSLTSDRRAQPHRPQSRAAPRLASHPARLVLSDSRPRQCVGNTQHQNARPRHRPLPHGGNAHHQRVTARCRSVANAVPSGSGARRATRPTNRRRVAEAGSTAIHKSGAVVRSGRVFALEFVSIRHDRWRAGCTMRHYSAHKSGLDLSSASPAASRRGASRRLDSLQPGCSKTARVHAPHTDATNASSLRRGVQ